MPYYQNHHRSGGLAPPRRLITIAVSVVSFLILAVLAIAHFGPSSELHARKLLAQHIDRAQSEPRATSLGDKYLIGVGKADVTGPVVEIGFGGYADLSQVGSGLRQRLYSRAFIIGETQNPQSRVVYIVLDTLSGDTAVRNGVLDALKGMGDEYAMYGQSNIALTGTHSHSGPGAWLNYLLPQITTLGFSKQSYQAIVDGAVLAIKRAHESLQEVGNRPVILVGRGRTNWTRVISTSAQQTSTTGTPIAVPPPTSPTPSPSETNTPLTPTRP